MEEPNIVQPPVRLSAVRGGGWGGYVECTIIGALSVTEEKECEDSMHIPHVTCMMYTSLYSINYTI